MITRLRVRRFKRLTEADIELGDVTVLVGPNNSGKTTALQALALWELGVRAWRSKRGDGSAATKRPGVTLNRKELISIPVGHADLLWSMRRTRAGGRDDDGKPRTSNLRIDVIVDGVSGGRAWACGLEFDFSNEESFACRPIRLPGFEDARVADASFTAVPDEAGEVRVAYLPPMSGLADTEFVKQDAEIDFLIWQGRTAELLRNLCLKVHRDHPEAWDRIVGAMDKGFGCRISDPEIDPGRGDIRLRYTEGGVELDILGAGRGLQQQLLLLCHLMSHPGTVHLLDEPDAHLEVLRQREVYGLVTEFAGESGSQVIAATHSEVVMQEAAARHVVIGFLGRAPRRLDGRQSLASLRHGLSKYRFDQYLLSAQRGWVLYLEGPTDLEIIRAFAERLDHPARAALVSPFVHHIGNRPSAAAEHFAAMRLACPRLVGLTLTDRIDGGATDQPAGLVVDAWRRREIENYLCDPETLVRYARAGEPGSPFEAGPEEREAAMRHAIEEHTAPADLRDPGTSFWRDAKVSDSYLPRVFEAYYARLGVENLMTKRNYHVLARHVDVPGGLDPEVTEKLDAINRVAEAATPEG